MTETEAAALMEIAPKTLRNWRSAGKGPPFTKRGMEVVYHLSDIQQWALDKARPGTHLMHYGLGDLKREPGSMGLSSFRGSMK